MKFSQDLFQTLTISTLSRLATAMLTAGATFSIVGCGGGGTLNSAAPPPTVPETEVTLSDLLKQRLAVWRRSNQDGTIIVPAGEERNAGVVRFLCPESGVDCTVSVMLDGDSVMVTSTGGMATAHLVMPPPPDPPPTVSPSGTLGQSQGENRKHSVAWLHGLNTVKHVLSYANPVVPRVLADGEIKTYLFLPGETRLFGRVRFKCEGPGECYVDILRDDSNPDPYTYKKTGNVTTSFYNSPMRMHAGIKRGWAVATDSICNDQSGDSRCMDGIGKVRFLPDNFVLTEDTNAKISDIKDWNGKRYVGSSGGNMVESIVYTNAEGSDDSNYVLFGRWLRIKSDGEGTAGVHNGRTQGIQFGWGTQSGTVSYNGGATGYYALTGDDSEVDRSNTAGYFTAKVTLQADLGGVSPSVSGIVNRFVDEKGRSRNWSVELPDSFLFELESGQIFGDSTRWTINETTSPQEPGRTWAGQAADEGNVVYGEFSAVFGTRTGGVYKNRMIGSFGAVKQ